tara:strand:- start:26 stop:214 length:189 start_codon:yes stop_codon:yes gene_type:complete
MVDNHYTESQIGFCRAFARELLVAKDIEDPIEAIKDAFYFLDLFEKFADEYRKKEDQHVRNS